MKNFTYKFKGRFKSLVLTKFGWSIVKGVNVNEFKRVILILEKSFIKVPLIRIGERHDGGYLVPAIVEDCDVLFSPGVAETYDFEIALWEQYGIKSFMIDASVTGPRGYDYMSFKPLFLKSECRENHSITLDKWLKDTGELDSGNRKILQMDIEGGEYEVLSQTTPQVLAKFDIIIIEFHFLTDLLNHNGLLFFEGIINKLLTHFHICHLHGNNGDRVASLDGFQYPECIEISFIRKDLETFAKPKRFQELPDILDFPNVSSKPEIKLGKIWGNL